MQSFKMSCKENKARSIASESKSGQVDNKKIEELKKTKNKTTTVNFTETYSEQSFFFQENYLHLGDF